MTRDAIIKGQAILNERHQVEMLSWLIGNSFNAEDGGVLHNNRVSNSHIILIDHPMYDGLDVIGGKVTNRVEDLSCLSLEFKRRLINCVTQYANDLDNQLENLDPNYKEDKDE